MSTVHDENKAMLAQVVSALPKWENRVLFIGGATLGLYSKKKQIEAIRAEMARQGATSEQASAVEEALAGVAEVEDPAEQARLLLVTDVSAATYNWQNAINYCHNLGESCGVITSPIPTLDVGLGTAHTDWRLPTP